MASQEAHERSGQAGGAPVNPEGFTSPPSPAVRRALRGKGGRGGGKAGRKKAKEFMDVADEAFAHQVAMAVWHEAEAVLGASPSVEEGLRRLRELGSFEDRGRFAPIWKSHWEAALGRIGPAASPSDRLGFLREAVLKSIEEEDEARQREGLPRLIDEDEGQRFIEFALNRMFEEASGEIEEGI